MRCKLDVSIEGSSNSGRLHVELENLVVRTSIMSSDDAISAAVVWRN